MKAERGRPGAMMRPDLLRDAWRWGLALAILLAAFGLRLYQLDTQSIWWDEGHSIQMAAAPIPQIPTLPGMDVHPPAYFVTLHLWMTLTGNSEFALRYLSVCFSLLTVALVFRFGWLLGGEMMAWLAAFLVTVSPFYIAYAQEVRMYAMVTFLATAAVYCQWRLLLDSPSPAGGRWLRFKRHLDQSYLAGAILFTTAALYAHYFTIFLICFQNLLWLAWYLAGLRRNDTIDWWWRGLGAWFGSQAAILLLFGPQLRLALAQVTGYTNPNLLPPTLGFYLSHSWQAYTLGLTIDPARARPLLLMLAVLALGALLVRWRDGWMLVLLGWFLIPLGLYFLVLQRQPSYEPRYLIVATPALFLALTYGFTALSGWSIWPEVAVGGLLLVGLHSYFTDPAFFKDDAAAVAAWLAAETTPQDMVLVDVPHPFHYYDERIPAPTRYFFVDINTAAAELNGLVLGRDHLFWVTWWGSDTDPRGVIPFLLRKQAGPSLGEQVFKGYRVTWYKLSAQPFSLPVDLPVVDVNFDNVLQLDGLAYSETVASGAAAWATLHFTLLRPTAVNYKVSLRLRTPEGTVLAQDDRLLLNDRHFQTAAWPLADPALNQTLSVYTLQLIDPAYSGPLTLEAVVYDAETLAAIAAYGAPTTNDDLVSAQLGQVAVR